MLSVSGGRKPGGVVGGRGGRDAVGSVQVVPATAPGVVRTGSDKGRIAVEPIGIIDRKITPYGFIRYFPTVRTGVVNRFSAVIIPKFPIAGGVAAIVPDFCPDNKSEGVSDGV